VGTASLTQRSMGEARNAILERRRREGGDPVLGIGCGLKGPWACRKAKLTPGATSKLGGRGVEGVTVSSGKIWAGRANVGEGEKGTLEIRVVLVFFRESLS